MERRRWSNVHFHCGLSDEQSRSFPGPSLLSAAITLEIRSWNKSPTRRITWLHYIVYHSIAEITAIENQIFQASRGIELKSPLLASKKWKSRHHVRCLLWKGDYLTADDRKLSIENCNFEMKHTFLSLCSKDVGNIRLLEYNTVLDDQPRQYWIYANTDNELAT